MLENGVAWMRAELAGSILQKRKWSIRGYITCLNCQFQQSAFGCTAFGCAPRQEVSRRYILPCLPTKAWQWMSSITWYLCTYRIVHILPSRKPQFWGQTSVVFLRVLHGHSFFPPLLSLGSIWNALSLDPNLICFLTFTLISTFSPEIFIDHYLSEFTIICNNRRTTYYWVPHKS